MEFMTQSKAMKELLAQAQKLAPGDHEILLLGESGTGKERLALVIHRQSTRARKAFVKVDCATMPERLWESELFGYPKGAFPGAGREGKLGKFDLAMGGTLFLDEVADVPLRVQAKLLRVLQDKVFEPVGSAQTHPADVRVIAATNKDLAALKERGLFREDLYYRLNGLSLTMPPLRERKEDLEGLTRAILAREAGPGAPVPAMTAEAIAALLLYEWPGNVRELENGLKRALLLAGGAGPIQLAHLPPEVAGLLQPSSGDPLFRRYIKSAELLLIRWALTACEQDRTRAARFLGLSRAALYKKLSLYPELRERPERA